MKKISCWMLALTAVVFIPLSAVAGDKELLIGLIPEENIFRQIKKHRPLAEYLTEKLGVGVRFTILSRYGDIIDRFVSREMDGAFFGIFTSVLAQEKLGVEPVVRQMNIEGSTTARGYLFVRRDSGIRTLADTKGKRAVFVDRATATGYIFAVAMLKENGVKDPDKYFSDYYFTGSHDSAVYAVLDGKAEIGAAKSRIFNKLSGNDPLINEELRIIAKSADLPDTTLCIRSDIAAPLKSKLKAALVDMDNDPRGREVLKILGVLKFVGANPEDFKPVVDLAGKAGIDIKDYKYR